ncbi:hypothetical protein E1211_12475 [Micromonospora sp. 15K316]|uniref:hypothetical protein n=1 Tax=Micromonospora sp. 15K316 TaxID=2530376 RepID=UPI0010468C20|nr:hypothetical protein [Micromonospora sp. 15K316]TDC36773.1 hypothetical protein E1211_12475 [Micromonospora sp. 15K316]
MNEADRLRAAMRATESTAHAPLDLAAVVREGRRLRRRRRLAGTGAAGLVLAVAVAVPVALRPDGPPPQRPAEAITTGSVATPTTAPTASATPDARATPGSTDRKPVGTVVSSGIRYGDQERVFYFVPIGVPELPGVKIGLVAGRRDADGRLTPDLLINDVEGRDRHAGFHQIGYDQQGDRQVLPPVPTFGYFVGPATRIVGTVDGRQVPAELARWSVDPGVVIFWFEPTVLTPGVRLDGIVALDKRGERL